MKSRQWMCFVLAMSIFAQDIWADSESEVDTELVGNISSQKKKMPFENLAMYYFSQTDGPNIDSMNNQLNDDFGEETSDRISVWNQISVRYPLSQKIDLIVNPRFEIKFTDEAFTLLDPVVGVQSVWYKNGKFAFFSTIDTELPLSDSARNSGELLSPGSFMDVSYQVTDKLMIGSWGSVRVSLFENDTYFDQDQGKLDEHKHLDLGASPYIQYQLYDNLAFRTYYDIAFDHVPGESWNTLKLDDTNLFVGVAWDANPDWNIYPYFIFSPNGDLSVESTSLGLMVSGRLF